MFGIYQQLAASQTISVQRVLTSIYRPAIHEDFMVATCLPIHQLSEPRLLNSTDSLSFYIYI